ncbi:hypothetical protein V7S43_018741 [Phytophthora oleae]|uniref:Acyltransferase n=1 Tax=Phytophthora oleae TaxID=2107226 RepID=A0ABD3EQ22_9STRA
MAENKDPQDGEALVYDAPGFFADNSKVPRWIQSLATDMFSFVILHYFVWGVPFLILFYLFHRCGLDYVAIAMVVLYLPSFFSGAHKTGKGNVWEGLRTSKLWGLLNAFLRMKIIREQELDAKKQYIFGFHPHGIIVLSRIAIFGGSFEDLFPGITYRILGASPMFYIPLGRELCLWMGGVDASRATSEKVLQEGNSIVVYPGGVAGIFKTNPNSKETQLVLKNRLGFVKLAMVHGAHLVPTFVFGEKWLYNMWNPPKSVISFFRQTLGIPVLVFWGKFWWMPKAPEEGKRYGVVYGKPITTEANPNPTDEQVRAIHTQYVAEVQRIFEQYKTEFGYEEDETLVIKIFRTNPSSKETQLVLKSVWGSSNCPFVMVPTWFLRSSSERNDCTICGTRPKPSGGTSSARRSVSPCSSSGGKFWWMPKAPPKGKRYGLVYGKPIATTLAPNPTDDQVRAVYDEYVAELERIFEQYKTQFGYEEDETLVIT